MRQAEPRLGLRQRLHGLRAGLDRWFGRPIPVPPPALAAGVGGGDWREVGVQLAALARSAGGLGREDRVLDLGCGLGRIVQPLRGFLSPRATYTGLDISAAYVAWCESEITPRDPRFRFVWVDARNEIYREEGAIDPAKVVFPFAADSFDFAIATSLFTHLYAAAAENYLAELARVFAPGGKLFATFFLLDDEARARIVAGRSDKRFATPLEHGATDHPPAPELAIAFERDWLVATLERSGFELVRPIARGAWCGEPGAPTYQDLVIAESRGGIA